MKLLLRLVLSVLGSFLIGFGIVWSIIEIVWLLSSGGMWFNTNTIPLQMELYLVIQSIQNIWTWILTIVFTPVLYYFEPWKWIE